jgi:RNA polymerase sigma factor (sigma-70 family)
MIDDQTYAAAWADPANQAAMRQAAAPFARSLDAERVADAKQDAILQALGHYDGEFGQSLPSSLYRYTRWACLNALRELRRLKRLRTVPLGRAGHLPCPRVLSESERNDVRESLGLIPDDQRAILHQHYFEGLSLREMGRANGYSQVTSMNRVRRALGSLREAYGAA